MNMVLFCLVLFATFNPLFPCMSILCHLYIDDGTMVSLDLNDVIIESMMSHSIYRRMNIFTIMTYNAWNFQWKCHLERSDVACIWLSNTRSMAKKNYDDGHNEARQGLQSNINQLLSIDSWSESAIPSDITFPHAQS